MSERYVLRTFGCQMNAHDSERIAGLLEGDGMSPTDDPAGAEVVVFNTCAIRENADNRLYGNLGHLRPLKERNPHLRIVVAGCLAQKDGAAIQERAPWVDVVVGTHALADLLELLERARTEGPQMDVREYTETFPSALPASRASAHQAWVSVTVGCDNYCTFCIVPLVRGPQKSRSIGDILAEVQGLARRGVVEVTLLGQNVNTYGRDLTAGGSASRPRFGELLRAVDTVDGIERVRFTSPHPHDFTDDVLEAMAECGSVCEHIHFPLQSGSDRILQAMQRSYRVGRYLEWLRRIRESVPGIAVSTDIIVGFPGETDADHEATLQAVSEARFDSAFTFIYSPRPGTRAAGFEGRVPADVARDRLDQLIEVQERISLERNEALVGRTVEALVEGEGRKGRRQGRTRTNKLVHFDGRESPGRLANVRVVAAHPHHLSGEVVSEGAAVR